MDNIEKFIVENNFKISEEKTEKIGKHTKEELKEKIEKNVAKIAGLQEKLYASQKYSVLVIFQGMDTSGKDSCIKNITRGLNPQGCKVVSFKKPTVDELAHDYMWRASTNLPKYGEIGIFNRSYYEDVLVVRVHNLLKEGLKKDGIWHKRFKHINNYEEYLSDNNTVIIKIFLNISKEEQKSRLLERLNNPEKNWKFEEADVQEREYWDRYHECYEKAMVETSTKIAPWYVVPSDDKTYSRYVVSEIILKEMEKLDVEFPAGKDSEYVERHIAALKLS